MKIKQSKGKTKKDRVDEKKQRAYCHETTNAIETFVEILKKWNEEAHSERLISFFLESLECVIKPRSVVIICPLFPLIGFLK